jgi:four helix bundle protein
MGKLKGIEDLQVWQSARLLAQGIEDLLNSGALDKNRALKMQIQRSSISVVSNIAEGFGRGGNKEFINFLSIARGSLAEVLSQLILARDFGYFPDHEYKILRESIENTAKLIGGMTRHLKRTAFTGSKYREQDRE